MNRRWSIRLVRIAGIEVRLHASMLLLVWLVGAYAPEDPRGVAGASAWVATIFGCVLVHEFAHSLVARNFGIAVHEIELLPIGGVSKMERIPDNPHQELAIALAGPVTSLAIGFTLLAFIATADGSLPPFDLAGGALPSRAGWFNLVIGAFNLLPALPLDGGRVLRAVFERREGALVATHHAARIARRVAWVMIGVGALTNVFLMIIGLFVHVMSRTEEVSADVHHALAGLHASDLMIRRPVVLSSDCLVGDMRRLLGETAQRQFPVLAAGRYGGIVDVRRVADASDAVPVSSVLSDLPAVNAATGVEEISWARGSDAVAVVDDGGVVVGLLRSEDVMLAAQSAVVQAAA